MILDDIGPDAAYSTRLLTPPDLLALQRVFEKAADYFELSTGVAPARDEAQRAFVAGPPTKSVNDKRTVGVFYDGTLVGVLDAITHWPSSGTWTIGVMLLVPAHRGKGLGSSVLKAFEVWAYAEGARRLRTAVVSRHEAGLAFAERSGYSRLEETSGPTPGVPIVHLERNLTV